MVYKIKFDKKAKRFFSRLQKEDKKQITQKLKKIRINPKSYLIKLINSDLYKLKVGDFRLFIDLYENELIILVVRLGKRKSIYKR